MGASDVGLQARSHSLTASERGTLSPSRTTAKRPKTVAFFDVSARLDRQDEFYDLPYPFDGRIKAGTIDLAGLPISPLSPAASTLRTKADEHSGFPVNTAGYFRFSADLMPQDPDQIIAGHRRSPIWLLDIDPDSPDRGTVLPTVASTLDADAYVPDHGLAVAPAPGIILRPDTTYAYVVKRSFQDAEDRPLGVSSDFQQLRDGEIPEGKLGKKTYKLFKPFWQTLDSLNVSRRAIAAATVFTTGDVVADLSVLSDQILDRYDLSIDNLQFAGDPDQEDARFYRLSGTVDLPQFQTGTPPFDLIGGQFEFDADGNLIEQRVEADVPIVLTLPKTPMPDGGYPLVVYYHGSNGLHTQVIDRGPILEPGGEPTPGLGPAYVLAQKGFATLGMALPMNPERLPNAGDSPYLNPLNLAAYPDTFQQGVLEQRLILEAIANLEIPSEIFGTLNVDQILGSHSTYRINSDSVLAMGQSHGAQYATMVSAVEPKIGAVVPTGSGGFWSRLATESEAAPLFNLLLGTSQNLNFLHPAFTLLQTAWESADPIVYMPRLARRPLPGHPARSIYQPVGLNDPEFPEPIYDAVALATGLQQAGDVLWPGMQASLSLDGLDGILAYPIVRNLRSENGRRYTGVVVQYEGDGITSSHNIFAQLDAVKIQYAHFFKSFYMKGKAVVIDPDPQP
ncbi:MAG: hypothetical protein IGR76_03650 [Synechococcales cyanobacterium T60_A2020_003]|nr:hypothetical protein [Synechococcales cyanobacterium T60_A2020_003]